MSFKTIGRCSLCNGDVVQEDHYTSAALCFPVTERRPYCTNCHAVEKLRVIEMEHPPKIKKLRKK